MENKRSAWNDSELDSTVDFSVSVVSLQALRAQRLNKLKETAE
jgi:hypothetical protein